MVNQQEKLLLFASGSANNQKQYIMATVKKAQSGAKVNKSKQNPADEYKGMKDAKGKPAVNVGGEGKKPPFDKNSPVLPLPGRKAKNMPKSKNGKSFPDLNKDGKVTRADILKGRGVIAKKGATIKKAQYGGKAASMVPMKKAMMGNTMMKSGGKMKTCKGGC
jgi:hypothetical protein